MYYCKLRFCQLPIADGTCSFSANKSQYLEWPVFLKSFGKGGYLIDEQGFTLAASMAYAEEFTLKGAREWANKAHITMASEDRVIKVRPGAVPAHASRRADHAQVLVRLVRHLLF